jgi:tRNA pseudouridine55 synthase
LDGIININKPKGKTSFSVVARIRKLSGERRVGHAGTLDPDATGVLPVCLGQGTRVIEFLVNTTKTYRARIEFGRATDTYDGSGQITHEGDISDVNKRRVEAALDGFRGRIEQTPPMYSAVKHGGQPLYKLARAGITVERKKRTALIHRLELTLWRKPLATVEVECSKGTYVRSLAHNLGEHLGCGAFLKSLVRTRCGIFDIGEAISLPQFEEAHRHGYWEQYLLPIDSVLQDLPTIVIDEDGEKAFKTGRPINPGENDTGNNKDSSSRYCRAYSQDGRFLGILRRSKSQGVWEPKKVMV